MGNTESTTDRATLKFLGATGTVTGSRYLLEAGGRRILIDCGLFQGYKELRERNWDVFDVPPDTIDFVLLTHAHLDHGGYIPRLVREGFRGQIIASEGTAELASIMLPDSAHLLEEEAERAARKKYSKHAHPKPLYTVEDADLALARFRTVKFGEPHEVVPGVTATFLHAGHILGASQLRLTLVEPVDTSIHFTGDLGRVDDMLMIPPTPYEGSDILITESTYGNRVHPVQDAEAELAPVLKRVLERGGTVVIPAFAVGRAQALQLVISRLFAKGAIPKVPVYLNSPMAVSATEFYERHRGEHKVDPAEFEAMYEVAHLVKSVEESKRLNENKAAKIIIAASGMMTGGRVLHHVVAFGEDPKNAILLSGYQAGGTRGRLLSEGAETLRIFGRDVPIRAEVVQLESMSAHADAKQIVEWMRTAPTPPTQVYVTHGEPDSSDALRWRIQNELGWPVRVPHPGETVQL